MARGTPDAAQQVPRAGGKANRPARTRRRAGADLTPMIDVTFLLLLFFLLTFTFRQKEGVLPHGLPRVPPPGTTPGGPGREVPLEIRLLPCGPGGTGAVYEIAGRPFVIRTPQALYQALRSQAEIWSPQTTPVRIVCRGDVQWRWALEACNQARRATFTQIEWTSPQ